YVLIRRPPRSPLFPSTTALPICPFDLHRHGPAQRSGLFAPGPDIVGHLVQSGLDRRRIDQIAGEGGLRAARLALAIRIDRAMILDRKSTRLNSSHVKISYAVFCL